MSSARNAGESAICPARAQPSAEIVRVECAKRRRECVRCARNPLRRSCVSSARDAGESANCPVPGQPFAEIVRVERAECRRECDLSGPRTTLCGDRACRVCEMQVCAQPSAEIVRVECAKCRRVCDLSSARATLCGDRACRVCEMQTRVQSVRCARDPLRRSCVSSARNAGESAI